MIEEIFLEITHWIKKKKKSLKMRNFGKKFSFAPKT
jgi:hypothetical protein